MYNQVQTVKNTHELKEGEIVLHYGAYFQLTERKAHGMRKDDCPTMQGECITFVGVEIAREANAPMPKHWTTSGYNIQGNKLATWLVISAE